MDGTFDQDLILKNSAANKYTILAANLTWLCFNVSDAPAHLVYATENFIDYMSLHIPDEHTATIGNLK